MSIIEYIGSIGGVGGVLASLMFLAYRYLVRQMREDRKYMENRLTMVIREYNRECRASRKVAIKHSSVLTELITYLKMKNGGKK